MTETVTYRHRPARYERHLSVQADWRSARPLAPINVYTREKVVQQPSEWSAEGLQAFYDLDELFSDLENIAELKTSANAAIQFLVKMAAKAKESGNSLRKPSLHAADGNSVGLFWSGDTDFLISFDTEKSVCGYFGKSDSKGTAKGGFPIGANRYDLLDWLVEQ